MSSASVRSRGSDCDWRAAYIMRLAQSASRTARRQCGLTSVVRIAFNFNSTATPSSTAVTPLESASVSSVTLPVPIRIGTSGSSSRRLR